jgi:hypothetical protein
MANTQTEQIRKWEQELNVEVEALRQRRSEIESELQVSTRKLELVRQMLALDEKGLDVEQQQSTPENHSLRPTPATVRDCVKRVLQDAGKPLHISEIHREFLSHAYPIPGSGTAFNILAHIVKNGDFVRVARGTYALIGDVIPDQVLASTKRKRRRRRSRKSQGSQAATQQLGA